MLRKNHPMTLLALAGGCLMLTATGVLAQAAQPEEVDDKPMSSLEEMRKSSAVDGLLSKTSAEDIRKAEESARNAMQSIVDAYQKNLPAKTKEFEGTRRKSDQIADDVMQAERDKALEFLGIDPQSNTSVAIFLSWSMPLELMRSYVLDAMWSGASVYFRGVPPGKELPAFVTKDLRTLVYGKHAANIAIDPRMFDAFNVTEVPTIVFSTTREQFTCKGVSPRKFSSGEKTLTYEGCPALPEDAYWKITGSVTTSYALNAFLEAGAPGVKPYTDAIAKGYAEGVPPGKPQKGFEGKWEDVLTPEELEMNRKFDERVKEEAAKKQAESTAATAR